MKTLVTLLSVLTVTLMTAQVETTWLGGTTGHETDWNTASNWSNGDVPDEDSHVVISFRNSGHHAQPLIDEEVIVASVTVHSMGSLTIEKEGRLIVDGSENYSEGILLYGGHVHNQGEICFYDLDVPPDMQWVAVLQDLGTVYLDNEILLTAAQQENTTAKR